MSVDNEYPDLTQMCRLCLSENADIPIYPSTPTRLSIPVRLMAVVSVEVQVTDELPKCLCVECRYQLERSYYFRKRSQVSESKLRKHLRLLNLGRKSRIFDKNYIGDEYLDDELTFEDSLEFLRQHDEKRAISERENVRAELCDEVKAELRLELQAECRRIELDCLLNELEGFLREKRAAVATQTANDLERDSSRRSSGPSRSEPTGDQQATSVYAVNKFDGSGHATVPTRSYDPGEDGTFSNDGDVHSQAEDDSEGNRVGQEPVYSEDDNKMQVDDVPQAKEHTETTSYQIDDFNKIELTQNLEVQRDDSVMVFNIEQSADIVELVSVDPDVVLMNETDESKTTSSCTATLIKQLPEKPPHAEMQPAYCSTHTPKTFKCNVCPMAYSSEPSLTRHLRTHSRTAAKGVSHQCSECKIHLSSKGTLARHMLIHQGRRPFSCEHCGRSFVQREILKRHLHTHTGERPHKCTECDRSYSQKGTLLDHINQRHKAVPPSRQHTCHLCPKIFTYASGLSRHLAGHAGVVFKCSACNRQFSDRSSIKRHIVKMHGVDNENGIENDDAKIMHLASDKTFNDCDG